MDFKHPRELRKLHQKYQKKAHDSQPVWDSTFKDDERPNLYKQSAAGDVFPAVTDVNTFISQLADPGQLSQKELFVALENSHLALQAAQDEYLAIEKVLRHMQGSDTDDLHDPQQLEDFELFDEKKKARLYGYNLSTELVSGMDPRTEDEKLPKVWQVPASKPDLLKTECDRLLFVQNPFHQPGFVPTKDEATNIRKAIKDGERGYLDGFAPFTRRGKQMVPQLYRKRNVYEPQPVTGVRRQTRSQAREERMEAFGPSRAASSERETDFDTKTRRSTRRTGIRTPRTREASVTPAGSPASRRRKREPLPPSTLSAAVSPAGSPASKRRRLEPVPQSNMSTAASPAPQETPTPSRQATDSTRTTPTPPAKRSTKAKKDASEVKWTDETLVAAVKEDHTFLCPWDPVRADKVKKHILAAPHPVRSYSMFKKWGAWKVAGEDKRPRKKK